MLAGLLIQLAAAGSLKAWLLFLYDETCASGRVCKIVLSFIAGRLFSTLYPFLLLSGEYLSVTPSLSISIVFLQVSYTNPFKSLLGILQNFTPLKISSLGVSSKMTSRNLELDRYSCKPDSSQFSSTIS